MIVLYVLYIANTFKNNAKIFKIGCVFITYIIVTTNSSAAKVTFKIILKIYLFLFIISFFLDRPKYHTPLK